MTPLLLKLMFTLIPKRAPALIRPNGEGVHQGGDRLLDPQVKQHMDYWEGELAKSEWFAGNEFTAADIQMSFPLEAASARGGLAQGHPKAAAFLARIHARPAYPARCKRAAPTRSGRPDVIRAQLFFFPSPLWGSLRNWPSVIQCRDIGSEAAMAERIS